MYERIDRVRKIIRNEICAILAEETNDPRISGVTITRVDMSPDLKSARIYYVVDDESADMKAVGRGLRSAVGFIRGRIAGRINMKFTPFISFRRDTAREKERTVRDLLEKVRNEGDEAGFCREDDD
ncbi:MAG: 30S ribosome-binding factor RbfA [Candidatus Omnitrophica bacterium]|nr:30S ribosome-binding factor RbfA [Candidatus Omnitrophota bacterium]